MFLTIKRKLSKPELFEIELFVCFFFCLKMDLELDNLQSLICHKTQTNKQTIFSLWTKV